MTVRFSLPESGEEMRIDTSTDTIFVDKTGNVAVEAVLESDVYFSESSVKEYLDVHWSQEYYSVDTSDREIVVSWQEDIKNPEAAVSIVEELIECFDDLVYLGTEPEGLEEMFEAVLYDRVDNAEVKR